MDSILFVARSVTTITALAFIAYLYARRRQHVPLLSRWILWFATILLANIAIQWMPAGALRTSLVVFAWAVFLIFLPGFLSEASRERKSALESRREAAEIIAGIVVARERAGRPVIRIDCIDHDGKSRVVYSREKARQAQ